jgi:hypothetical protein
MIGVGLNVEISVPLRKCDNSPERKQTNKSKNFGIPIIQID